MTEQDMDMNERFFSFCKKGEGRDGIATVLTHILQREGGWQGLHRFIFENDAFPHLGAHFLESFNSCMDSKSCVGFIEQFANELGFDNIYDYFDEEQKNSTFQLTYSVMLGLGTETDHEGIGKKIRNALRYIPKPSETLDGEC